MMVLAKMTILLREQKKCHFTGAIKARPALGPQGRERPKNEQNLSHLKPGFYYI
jgi:hypothetical protein